MDANKLKSFIAIKIIEKLAKKTVILVDEIFLAQQWYIYFKKNTDIAEEKILILHGKTKKADWARIETADIIIASKDSLSKKDPIFEILEPTAAISDDAAATSGSSRIPRSARELWSGTL